MRASAQVITTWNVKDFGELPEGVEAQSPDVFLCNLLDLDPESFVELLREQAADLINPPLRFEDLLERLARAVPNLIAAVREHVGAA